MHYFLHIIFQNFLRRRHSPLLTGNPPLPFRSLFQISGYAIVGGNVSSTLVSQSRWVTDRCWPWPAVCRVERRARRRLISHSRCPYDATTRRRHVTESAVRHSHQHHRILWCCRWTLAWTSRSAVRLTACHERCSRSWTESVSQNARTKIYHSVVSWSGRGKRALAP